jgi:tight adherence protein B
VTAAILLAAVAAALMVPMAALVAKEGLPVAARVARPVTRSLGEWLRGSFKPVADARVRGEIPTDIERLRLQAIAGASGLVVGIAMLGVRAGVIAATALPWLASRLLGWHRGRYRRRLDEGAAGAALAVSDALLAGRSVRSAVSVAARSLEGPMGLELRTLARELELGADTSPALENFRTRANSRRVDLIVAAIRLQRRSGGGLAELLREIAATMAERDRVEADVRATTAQARFTANVVLCLPLIGLLLAELAAPGLLRDVAASRASGFLLVTALLLQVCGTVVVRQLTRTEN